MKNVKDFKNVEVMDFGASIKALEEGKCVARIGWYGKGLFIYKHISHTIPESIVVDFVNIPDAAKKLILNSKSKSITYTSMMYIVHPTGRADSWVPSSSDIFAKDWYIVE